MYVHSHAYKYQQKLASQFDIEMHRQMTEQKRTLVLAYLLFGLLISSQCVHSIGFVNHFESAESREAQLGRKFMFVDTVSTESIPSAFYIQFLTKSSCFSHESKILLLWEKMKGREQVRASGRKNPSGPNPIGNRHPPSIQGWTNGASISSLKFILELNQLKICQIFVCEEDEHRWIYGVFFPLRWILLTSLNF